MIGQEADYISLRDVSRECQVKYHQARYIVDAYDIEPAMRIAGTRFWRREQLPLIRSAISRAAANRGEAFR